jgi:cellulose biosynthesis protein BcsQ
MKVAAVVSTKGGPGKTTVGVNLGAFCADAGIRTLLIDLDNQPSLSSSSWRSLMNTVVHLAEWSWLQDGFVF